MRQRVWRPRVDEVVTIGEYFKNNFNFAEEHSFELSKNSRYTRGVAKGDGDKRGVRVWENQFNGAKTLSF